MIKDVVLKLECSESRDKALDYAITIAETLDAHLTGVAFADGPALANYPMLGVPPGLLTEIQADSEKAARGAIARFEAAARRSLLSAEPRLITESKWGESSNTFSAMARRFDLSVIMQSDNNSGAYNDLVIEATLFDSGRPVIVVPYIQKEGLKLDRVVCCWDGSRSAARALNDALPLLQKAKIVDLFIVDNEKTKNEGEIRGVGIGDHLARHDVEVEVKVVSAPDIDVANVILSYVADCSADMIVMGGYGHSRFREFLLGGVTRAILSSMTVPVFISH